MEATHGRQPVPLPPLECLGPYHDDGDMGLFPPASPRMPVAGTEADDEG